MLIILFYESRFVMLTSKYQRFVVLFLRNKMLNISEYIFSDHSRTFLQSTLMVHA
jgi:hypothetical protein